VALNHANCGSERHDSWFKVVAFTRTTPGSLRSQYSISLAMAKATEIRALTGAILRSGAWHVFGIAANCRGPKIRL
jgi:ketopantoate reductase